MGIRIILLIGIVFVAQSVAAGILNEKIVGEDGQPIRCGTRWKPEDGVKYKIYYGPKEQVSYFLLRFLLRIFPRVKSKLNWCCSRVEKKKIYGVIHENLQ